MSSAVRVGDSTPLKPHLGARARKSNGTPAPGAYDVGQKHDIKYTKAPASQFGGNMCRIDRDRTGLRAQALRNSATPGPNSYSILASKQKLDVKSRAPTCKFGSSERSDGSKLYVHRKDATGDAATDPNRATAGRGVPGPGAYATTAHALEATKKAAPRFSFGLKPALDPQSASASAQQKIGPGTYTAPSSLGKQLISNRPTSPGFAMGACSREKMGEVLMPGFSPTVKTNTKSPGPSNYDQVSGCGKQLVSTRRSASAYSFGSDGRLKSERDRGVPGPGAYDQASMLGIQSDSKFLTFGGFKFGTSQRPETSDMANISIDNEG